MSALRFFDPYAPLRIHERNLPHWEQKGVAYFLTWRLYDSLPSEKLASWKREKDIWIARHPPPWSAAAADEYRQRFCAQIEAWLDAGLGSCALRDATCREILEGSLRYFEATRYRLDAYVIMPNHVHVILRSVETDLSIAKVIQSWKGYSARIINRHLDRRGPFWQEGYWDRIVRNEAHLTRCRSYIRNNPIRAHLASESYTLFLSQEAED